MIVVLTSTLVLLCYRNACDVRVVRLLRERIVGNSVTQTHKKLLEQHSEDWLTRTLQYLTACQPFTESPLTAAPTFAEPPERPSLPNPRWLLAVYVRDVVNRLDDVKAKLTSVFGAVLKLDSTKKVFIDMTAGDDFLYLRCVI